MQNADDNKCPVQIQKLRTAELAWLGELISRKQLHWLARYEKDDLPELTLALEVDDAHGAYVDAPAQTSDRAGI